MTIIPRAVISGIGTLTPIGVGNDRFWNSLRAGRSGIGLLRSFSAGGFPSKLAAEIHEFDPLDYVRPRKMLKFMSRDTQLGTSAAAMAMSDAGFGESDIAPERLGVTFGCGRISTLPEDLVDAATNSANDRCFEYTRWGEDSMGKIAPLWLLKRLPNMTSCHVAIQHNAQGPNNTITCRDSSALLALAESVRVIERGAADVVIVGATSSNIHPVDLTKYNLFENLTPQDDPDSACRPFDVTRNGTVIGEGAAAFVVERYDHAIRRGAEIYGEVIGVGAGCDGSGYTNGSGGRGIARAIQAALKRAGIAPRDIGHINADGKSTQREDLVEAKGYHWGLGESALKIPVTAMKSYFGHFDAGSGAVELAGTLLSLKHQLVPPTLNYKIPDPRCRLNVVPEPLELRSSTAMTVNRTSMGQSVAAIIRTL
jgi:3-oxoacyl-[acyl-carrier-protein] synthase II